MRKTARNETGKQGCGLSPADFCRWAALPALAVLAFLAPAPAAAEPVVLDTISTTNFIEDLFAWSKYSLRIGAGVLYSPDYEGSSRYRLRLLPVVDLRWKQIAYLHDKSLRVNLIRNGWLKAGPILSFSPGRHEDNNPDLQGLGDVGNGLEVGGFAESLVGPFALRFDVQKEVAGGYGGVTSHLEAGFLAYRNEKLSLVTGARVSFAGKNYMNAFFGVTPAQSAASGLPIFHARGGVKDIGIGILTDYLISDNWSAGSVLGCSRLLGDAAGNPLVKERGSANQCIAFVRLTYQLQ